MSARSRPLFRDSKVHWSGVHKERHHTRWPHQQIRESLATIASTFCTLTFYYIIIVISSSELLLAFAHFLFANAYVNSMHLSTSMHLFTYMHLSYPEWRHRQCIGLAYIRSCVRVPVAPARLVIYLVYLHRAIRGAQGALPCVGWEVMVCQWDLPSLTPVHSRLWSTATGSSLLGYFSTLLQVVDNWLHILW